MTDKKNEGIRFNINSLEDLGFTFKKPEKSIPTERVDFALLHSIEINENDDQLSVYLKPRYTFGKRDPKTIAEFIFKITYDIDNLKNVIETDDKGNKSIPDGLVATLFSIGYSTMRGAFYEKSKGTMAERLIIPVINPVKLLEESQATDEKPQDDL